MAIRDAIKAAPADLAADEDAEAPAPACGTSGRPGPGRDPAGAARVPWQRLPGALNLGGGGW
ncbi:hypothetical protein AB0D08_28000 [Kitasatospora sp. NPDC048540]|uniref:hypothetical protein n=1 Tax=Kitasatospora sp. NPDC048540 TaxID=3155634 RepID=UPI003402785C